MISGIEIFNIINHDNKVSNIALNVQFHEFFNNNTVVAFNNFITNNLKNTKNRIMNEVVNNIINNINNYKISISDNSVDFNKLLPSLINNFAFNMNNIVAYDSDELPVTNGGATIGMPVTKGGVNSKDESTATIDILDASVNNPEISTGAYFRWAKEWFGVSDDSTSIETLTTQLAKNYQCHSSRAWR